MGRLLLLLLLIALAYGAWRLVRKALTPPPTPGDGAPPQFEPTARCPKCGTHVPRAELGPAGTCSRCRS